MSEMRAGLRGYIGWLEHVAVKEKDIPADVAACASARTARTLDMEPDSALSRRRAKAYFDAVVRKQLVRHGQGGLARARLVLATVEADLREAGRGETEVWDEIVRGWADKVPASVLEEYRRRLCA